MNHIRRIGIDGVLTFAASKLCHPEWSLAASEASSRTQSKDPITTESITGNAKSFRIVVRFFDDQDAEILHDPSREVTAWESPARQCRVTTTHTIESRRDATLA